MKVTVSMEHFKEHLTNRNFSQKSINGYHSILKNFFLFILKNDVREITREDITRYLHELHTCGRYTKSSQRTLTQRVSNFFKYLYRHEYILVNPFDNIDIDQVKRYFKRESIDQDKLIKILDSITGTSYLDLRDRAMLELMYGCGLRAGEVIMLNMTDVDFQGGKIFIQEGKGRKDRIVPVGRNALSYLKRYVEYGRSYLVKIVDRETLILSYKGRRMSNKSINTALQKRAHRIYPELKIHAHLLRHSFATHMLEAGASIKQVKDILGHSCIESTVIYTHFNSGSMRKILKMYHPRENELYEEFNEDDYHIRK